MKKLFFIPVILCGLAVCVCFRQTAYARGTGAAFLKIAPDSKASAMGGAYTALADDVGSTWWNPGGIARIDKQELTGTHAEWLAGTRYDYIGYAHPLTAGAIGVNVSMLEVGTIESRDAAGNAKGNFTARDLSVSITYAQPIHTDTRLGISAKFISQSIEAYDAVGYCFDIGGITALNIAGLDVGYGIYNLGPKMKFLSESYDLPLRMAMGLGYRLNGIRIAADFHRDYYARKTSFLLGTEYSILPVISLRMGYMQNALRRHNKTNMVESALNAYGLRAGFGMQLFGNQFDYAFVPYGNLGSTHRVSFGTKF